MAENLVKLTKVMAQNIRTLHRHLAGGNWFGDHELLAEYYEKVDEMEDAFVEICIALDYGDCCICEASESYKILPCDRDYSKKEAFSLVKIYFEKLREVIKEFKASHPELPSGVVSELDNYDYWLFLEGEYKIKRFLTEKE